MRRRTTPAREAVYPRPRKRFGQHFLHPSWVAKLVARLELDSEDTVLEIGAGRGALTDALAQRVRRVIAVEIDRDLAAMLRARAAANVDVVLADFLRLDLEQLLRDEQRPVRVVGNLPYNVSSPILFRLLDVAARGSGLRDATLMLQREVAGRLAAGPGSREYGTLAMQAALRADVEPLLSLPPGAFSPAPRVASAVVRLRFREPAVDVGDPAAFERIARGIFLHRRKTLLNALRALEPGLGHPAEDLIRQAGLDPSRRPETLTVADVGRLSRAVL